MVPGLSAVVWASTRFLLLARCKPVYQLSSKGVQLPEPGACLRGEHDGQRGFLGFALAGVGEISIVDSLLAVLAFALGATMGGRWAAG
jgi:hypothetical protein